MVLAPEEFLLNSEPDRAVKGLSAQNHGVVSAQIHRIRLMALGFALVLNGGSVGSAAEPPAGGDKILFSGAAEAVRLPESDGANARLSGAMELLDRGNSMSGALDRPASPPPAAPPRRSLSARLLERLERDRNWILQEPEDMHQMPTAEDVMLVWEYDLDRALGSRGASGTPSDRKSANLQVSPKALNPAKSDSAFLPDNRMHQGPGSGGSANVGNWLGPVAAFQPLPLAPTLQPQDQRALETSSSPLRRSRLDIFPSLGPGKVTPDIRELLASPESLNPLTTSYDPINMYTDSTRRDIHPVTSPSWSELGAVSRYDQAFLPTAPPGSSGNSRPTTVLDEMTAKILGPSSLSPALAVPVEPPRAKPKPNLRESFGRKL